MSRAPISGFNTLPIASCKKEYNLDPTTHIGYYNSSGRIYLLCPFHREKSPSLLVTFRREEMRFDHGKLIPDGKFRGWFKFDKNSVRNYVMNERYNRWKCFGCGEGSGNLYWLLKELRRNDGYHEEYLGYWENYQKNYKKLLDSYEVPF